MIYIYVCLVIIIFLLINILIGFKTIIEENRENHSEKLTYFVEMINILYKDNTNNKKINDVYKNLYSNTFKNNDKQK